MGSVAVLRPEETHPTQPRPFRKKNKNHRSRHVDHVPHQNMPNQPAVGANCLRCGVSVQRHSDLVVLLCCGWSYRTGDRYYLYPQRRASARYNGDNVQSIRQQQSAPPRYVGAYTLVGACTLPARLFAMRRLAAGRMRRRLYCVRQRQLDRNLAPRPHKPVVRHR